MKQYVIMKLVFAYCSPLQVPSLNFDLLFSDKNNNNNKAINPRFWISYMSTCLSFNSIKGISDVLHQFNEM